MCIERVPHFTGDNNIGTTPSPAETVNIYSATSFINLQSFYFLRTLENPDMKLLLEANLRNRSIISHEKS